ncbi:exodeoxyribonuclease VII small subunit [Marinilabilia salmonicolor]|jgi:exodeoxyribonuclease VII small subunit|uniref:Exodeoxyribonuclease VII small subunit n=1 Tax=Marinilabilia salmonicolor TaxID=989 RepID=A0A2T0XAG5_9BACT|nr:exodeoxyribonuclease VII small subunit [Marinilabilia salmonicolor]PRY95917.1 exodeoxyribonuclease VII small subunit [Marinilabilia salmonicolor]RCW29032.1 exodeoxyribonuclease VII small subunit [Marinilabilia salmonicolor]
MAQKKLTYNQAISEIEEILAKMENEELDVDELSDKVKRVSELVRFCRSKLKNTEEEVEKVLKEMEE